MPKLGNLASRVLVALVAVPILLLVMYQDHHQLTWAVVFAATLVAMHEYFAMTLSDATDRLASMAIGAAVAVSFYWLPELGGPHASAVGWYLGATVALFLAVIAPAIYYLFRFGDMTTAGGRLAATITGITYCGLLFTFVALLKRDFGGAGGDLILLVLLVAWLGDTGAYFAGRFLGKRKLYEAVSPKKTWAGAFGGLAASTGAAVFVKLVLLEELSWVDVAVLGPVAAAFGQMGDLFESILKRSAGVKDSGTLLPGHGGILDRIDAVLFIAPIAYLYLSLRLYL